MEGKSMSSEIVAQPLDGREENVDTRRWLGLAVIVVALFTVFSLLDGLAWSETSLIVFRSAQGLGAALLSPAALSILTTTFREGRELGLDLLHQHSGGPARARSHPVAASREPRRSPASNLRLRRCRIDHHWPDGAGLRDDTRDATWLADH